MHDGVGPEADDGRTEGRCDAADGVARFIAGVASGEASDAQSGEVVMAALIRGLGHTGGTLDDLGSIPGLRTHPDLASLTGPRSRGSGP